MKRSELKADPDKVREFIRRNRKPLRRSKPKTRAVLPPGVAKAVSRRCRGRCVVCGVRGPWLHRHHVLPVEKWPQYETEPLNLVLVCPHDHMQHEAAMRRIRRAELPPATLTWAYTLGGRETLYMERVYRL